MKDMIGVGEITDGSDKFGSEIAMKYRALRSDISRLEPDSKEFRAMVDAITKSQRDKSGNISILNIYSVRRHAEKDTFLESMPNQRLLFHGSRINNWVIQIFKNIFLRIKNCRWESFQEGY